MPFEFFPNTNFHDMNLDYILEKTQKIDDNMRDSQASADAAKASEEAAKASEDAAKLSEENAKASEEAAKDYADNIADPVSGIVTDWLEENITQETGYVLDASLTSAAAAAPAKTVGDVLRGVNRWGESGDLSFLAALYQGEYINSSDEIVTNSVLSHTDYIEVPKGAVIMDVGNQTSTAGGTTYAINPNVIFYDTNKTKIFAVNSSDSVGRYFIPSTAEYVRVNQPIIDAPVKQLLIKFEYADMDGLVGFARLYYDESTTVRSSTVQLVAGKTYFLLLSDPITSGHVNAYITGHIDTYAALYGNGAVTFTPKDTGYVYFAKVDAVIPEPLTVYIFEENMTIARSYNAPAVYHVGPTRHNTSFTGLLYSLRDDRTPKIIYVDGAEYDVFQEYTDLGLITGEGPANPSLDYFPYNVWVPDNTRIIGLGTIKLVWAPTTDQITEAWSKTISPLNMAGSASVENMEIRVKNGRYCIHDDPLGIIRYRGARKRYKNVTCYKYDNDEGYGFAPVIGFGLDSRMIYDFDNCTFEHQSNGFAFYMHDRTTNPNTEESGATVNVTNCIMETDGTGVALGNATSASSGNHRIRVRFNGCSIGGSFRVGDETNKSQGTNKNHFDITLLQCNNVPVQIASVNNPYPAKIVMPIGD